MRGDAGMRGPLRYWYGAITEAATTSEISNFSYSPNIGLLADLLESLSVLKGAQHLLAGHEWHDITSHNDGGGRGRREARVCARRITRREACFQTQTRQTGKMIGAVWLRG